MRITDTFVCLEEQTLIHCQPLLLTDTDYTRTNYFPCHNHVLTVDIVHCSIQTVTDIYLGLS